MHFEKTQEGASARGLVVTKTESHCKLVNNGSCSLDAAIVEDLSELDIFSMKKKGIKKNTKDPLFPTGLVKSLARRCGGWQLATGAVRSVKYRPHTIRKHHKNASSFNKQSKNKTKQRSII